MEPITGIVILDWFLRLLDSYGYLLVIGFTIFENLFVIGSFTPGETVVMAAAFLSTPEQGHLTLALVWSCSVIGTTIGSNVSYALGRFGGRDTLLRYGRRFKVDEEWVAAAEEYFYKHGSKTVFLSRFAAGFKNAVPVVAGVTKMQALYFEAWTLVGAVTYTTLMCAIGWFVGDNFDHALRIAARVGYVGFALFLVLIVVALWGRHRFQQRQIDRLAEQHQGRQQTGDIDLSEMFDQRDAGERDEP